MSKFPFFSSKVPGDGLPANAGTFLTFNVMKHNRRKFIQSMAMGSAVITTSLHLSSTAQPTVSNGLFQGSKPLPKPTKGQLIWQESEVGLIYHFDISVAAGDFTSHNNAYKGKFDPQDYNPQKLDTDQWIKAASAAGAKYAIFTGTHFNGFLQWQSDAYPYGLKQAKWKNGKGDVFGDFVKSCHKANIRPGVYISTHRNGYWDLWDYYVEGGKGKGTKRQEEFNHAAEAMVEEICSNYGPLIQIWFDAGTKLPGEGGPDVLPIFDKYQPNSVFYNSSKRSDHRWIGNEAGYADYPCWATMPDNPILSHNSPAWKPILGSGDPQGTIWSPGMVDVPLRGEGKIHNWFWAPGQDQAVHSKEALVDMYYKSVGRNSNLLIGAVVTPEGLVPESDIMRLKEFGDEIRARFGNPLAETKGAGKSLQLKFPDNRQVNHVIIQEDIAQGERIRQYTLEGLVEGKWRSIARGESVGQKRIERFDDVICKAIRLTVNQQTAEPQIKNLAAYLI